MRQRETDVRWENTDVRWVGFHPLLEFVNNCNILELSMDALKFES
jgi:hypothetical protein